MPNKMLIDSSHPEETRVVVVRGNRIEEFDFESQDKKQLKGNIYLARVTRVEPSLQAAFVEYGGNRHGFLAFSEIHPDYYQIPVADRQALLRAEAEEENDEDEDGDEHRTRGNRRRRRGGRSRDRGDDTVKASETLETTEAANDVEADDANQSDDDSPIVESLSDKAPVSPDALEDDTKAEPTSGEEAVDGVLATEESVNDESEQGNNGSGGTSIAAEVELEVVSEKLPTPTEDEGSESQNEPSRQSESSHNDDEDEVESVGAEDALEEVRNRRKPPRRQYKIQEVIKRRQILLVQVVKEERGNKGAALTTYLSLAGRYSVLMPNTARGGGISRKITNAQDRKRLKEVVSDLEVPQGMGVILRTAGESRTKAEIKRDYEYLMRLWDNVRELTLKSIVPALVYEEGSLIKRSVRDLYNKDIDEVLVAGENGYREAKDFMRMLMPSHAKVVQPYRDTTPLFARFGVEAQLDKMLQPQVTLKSGGYLIINQTEALVSIDVNSGRSTKEHSIEETALHTNLEAAEEVARQLRLRDLAGLIVIDFIDMEENRNNRAVEKRLKEHLKNDRARIQLGRISHFGLMEMSRQRIRASVLESTTKPCPHCGGTGHVRSDSSVALFVVRAIEEFLLKDSRNHIIVKTPGATALYVLNHKRSTLTDLERRFGLTITVEVDEAVGSQHSLITRGAVAEKPAGFQQQQALPPLPVDEEEDDIVEVDNEEVVSEQKTEAQESAGEGNRKRRRRRRRGGRDRDREPNGSEQQGSAEETVGSAESETDSDLSDEVTDAEAASKADSEAVTGTDLTEEDSPAKKRRRGKRGGKRNRKEGEEVAAGADSETIVEEESTTVVTDASEEEAVVADTTVAVVAESVVEDVVAETEPAPEPEPKPKKPRRAPRAKKAVAEAPAIEHSVKAEEDASPVETEAEPDPIAATTEPPAEEVASESIPAPQTIPTNAEASEPVVSSTLAENQAEPAPEQPKRGGWWQRRGFF